MAPYWADVDLTVGGEVKYYTYSTGDPVINEFNAGFAREGVHFFGKWLLLAHWSQVKPPQYGSENPLNIVSSQIT